MTIIEAAAALRARTVSSAELTAACLARIELRNPDLNAFVTVTAESARARAAGMDAELAGGRDRGPLHGIPIALKDVFRTKGVRTTCGSLLYADYVPDFDCAVTERLEAAGAVLVGKTGMHELAYGVTSNNPHFGAVRNPVNPAHVPGGSSGGSGAAVADGMCFMAMGSDTGGSIRIPAAFCGTVGLKPTSGRVSRYGVLPLDFTLDHMGPLTRSVRDAALCLEILAGRDERDDTSSHEPVKPYVPARGASIAGLRIGLPSNYYFDRVDAEVAAAVRAMAAEAARLGARVEPLRVPDIAEINAVARVILLCEASAAMEPHLARRDRFGADVLALLDQGRLIPATDYINAQRLRRMLIADFERVWDSVDCLFTPTTPAPAPRIGQATIEFDGTPEDTRLASTRMVRGFNLLGLPALSMPCGVHSNGLPMGLQIIGRAWREDVVLRAGAVLGKE